MDGLTFQWVFRDSPTLSFQSYYTLSFLLSKSPEVQSPPSNSPLPTPGWRNQIPTLLSLSYRVVCPDLIGFGRTAAPPVSPPYDTNTNIQYYSFKRAASDIAELAHQLHCKTIILGGHDWVRRFHTLPVPPFPFHLLQPPVSFLFFSFEHLVNSAMN